MPGGKVYVTVGEFFVNLFICVTLNLFNKFQSSNMLGTGPKVCGGGGDGVMLVWWWRGGGGLSLFQC